MVPEASINSDSRVESSSGGDNTKTDNGFNCSANGSRSSCDCNGDGDSMGLRSRTIHTYKRKKCGASSSEPKLAQLEKLVYKQASQSENKMVDEKLDLGLQKKSCEQVCCPKMNCHSFLNGSGDLSYQLWKSTLQNLFQSFSSDQGGMSGIKVCIRDALFSFQQMDYPKASMGNGDVLKGLCHTQQASEPKRCLNNVEGKSGLTSNESSSKLSNSTVTRQGQCALFRLVMSEKFKSLCKLFSENFHGVKFDKFIDFNILNMRMKEGVYEQAPALFASDVQELWRKVHVIGTEMISLAKSLSDLSRMFCREMGGSIENGALDDGKNKLFPCFDWIDRRDQPNSSTSKAMTCRRCEKMSDGRDCLVCDSCEEMFHVSCIEPAVTEIPHSNWYCANCTALGTACPHENCAVCERLNVTARTNDIEDEKKIPDELESSCCIVENGIQVYKGSSNKKACCKVCKSILERGELFRLCEHHACNHYYHVRCLTNKQLKSYCSRWYCPCCLCRVCLTDQDDDKIVLCDACDNAYHIYCMSPPQKSIPEGQWYCRKCEAGLQAIHKAKSAYNSIEEKEQKNKEERKRKRGCSGGKSAKVARKVVDRSGGVDMLLNAANAISYQEVLAALNNSS